MIPGLERSIVLAISSEYGAYVFMLGQWLDGLTLMPLAVSRRKMRMVGLTSSTRARTTLCSDCARQQSS